MLSLRTAWQTGWCFHTSSGNGQRCHISGNFLRYVVVRHTAGGVAVGLVPYIGIAACIQRVYERVRKNKSKNLDDKNDKDGS